MKEKKIMLMLAAALAVLVLVFAGVMLLTRPDTQTGSKTVTVRVYADGKEVAEHREQTDFEYLGELLLDAGIAEGENGDYGLFIISAAGVEADSEHWWCITKGGEEVLTGADSTPIYDGDCFELTLTAIW